MYKLLPILTMLLLMYVEGFSQDQIILNNGQLVRGKVLSSQPGFITYQVEGNDSVMVMNKGLITAIVYQNGFTDILSKGKGKGKNAMIQQYPGNRLSTDWLSFAGREVSFHYERIMGNGNIALRIPAGFVYNTSEFNYIPNSGQTDWNYDSPAFPPNSYTIVNDENGWGFRTGVSLVAYLNDARKVRAYLAPGIVTGFFSTSKEYQIVTFNPDTGDEIGRENKKSSDNAGFLGTDVMLGFNYLATPNLSIAFETGGGYGTYIPDLDSRSSSGIWRMSLLIGYNWPKK